ncbi:MAG: hypothetical protein A2516_08470 [Alphaproteobacteria bacterium RIFOXYD12_FULL_60_8]|nr:MAG: hypothetical protein A2516_08470 [Alphaproteobacteria bacterium RIFOXYD12_FULL_60_8]
MFNERNQPCHCGSGKKFKKCHGAPASALAPAPARKIDPFAFNKTVAYEGALGRQRKQFCEDYASFKSSLFDKMQNRQKEVAAREGKKISCAKGCWFCCTQYVGGSLQECETIVHWLYNNESVLKRFLQEYPKWREKVREHEGVFTKTNAAASACVSNPEDGALREAFLAASREYHRLNISCPFLADGACSIYPVRPLACGGLVAFSPPEMCMASNSEPPEVLITTPTVPEPSYFYGPDKLQINSPFALLVFQLLQNGYDYLAQIPGSGDLAEKVYSDPEVIEALRKGGYC